MLAKSWPRGWSTDFVSSGKRIVVLPLFGYLAAQVEHFGLKLMPHRLLVYSASLKASTSGSAQPVLGLAYASTGLRS